MRIPIRTLAALGVLTAASPALAHPGHDVGALAGFTHPFTGADHLVAMVLVGLWAAKRGGHALLAWPFAFAVALLAGYGLSLGHPALPMVEPLIIASVIGLGALVAADLRVGTVTGSALIATAGLLHGLAHGAEATSAASVSFPVGMASATALLHLMGLGAGLTLNAAKRPALVRALGAGAAVSGVAMTLLG
jgi:urease accessory protein